ncbi:hypothetical protein SmJEL517_g05353 [Synchytrium microbalum]|uniref:RRM domain-containing protein n=1 Tax=Synchytrium microbalum TaxID=1806994 RepID=A0A507BLU9_9FUNG|nr:uncharacterized protein SmJEL517_g05353 [Synchytrium microbalum]TPX31300.1 hypothetical protein SmJEL517_g05353 [Synchytrium microbalum]
MSYTRVYFGRIPRDTEVRDLEGLCGKYGRVRDCKVLNGFGFVEFDDPRDAADAVRGLDRTRFLGERWMGAIDAVSHGFSASVAPNIQVEPARGGRRDRDDRGPPRDRPRGNGPRGTGEFRLKIGGLPRGTSWQSKLSDVDRDGEGFVEMSNQQDMEKAIRELDDYEFREVRIFVKEDASAGRNGGGSAAGGGHRDRSRSPRGGRDRSRSPRRRSPSPRRSRSPPRRDRSPHD